jgi:mono/diheme cytochrome c family protein
VVELHRFADAGSGFKTTQLPRLMKSSSSSFRPVDVSVGPDGAIYVADWFNPMIGHYQTSYADPRRDKTHGRIWRITAQGRAPIKQPNLAAMKPAELMMQLRSPERWTRYQAKRLLFDAPGADVLKAADEYVAGQTPSSPDYERLLVEVIGVFEAHETARPELLNKLLTAKDPRVRAYGARVTGAWAGKLPAAMKLLHECARDEHPRVRLEAVVASSYLPQPEAVEIATQAVDAPRDPFLDYAIRLCARASQPRWVSAFIGNKLMFGGSATQAEYLRTLLGTPPKAQSRGQDLYEMACLPCHQPEGKGLLGVYPPLAGSEWVRGDSSRLIKILLHGLGGPITVAGQSFGVRPDAIAMPSLSGLTDEQIADVLTYVRNDFGEKAGDVSAEQVKKMRSANPNRETPWRVEELGK